MNKEYGGFIPFELSSDKGEYFYQYEDCMVRVNSGRTAICYAIEELALNKIHIPYYICPDVKVAVEEKGYDVQYYKLDKNMLPDIRENTNDAIVIWTNYFGLMTQRQIDELLGKHKNVILDNAQAFFARPIIKDNVYNAYSCRKFFGVPDGGYIIGKSIRKRNLERDVSWNKMAFIFQQLEEGTNAAYEGYLANENRFDNSYLRMSKLTQKILQGINYHGIHDRRRENFEILAYEFNSVNHMKVSLSGDEMVPFVYPLLFPDMSLRKRMIEKHIYTSTWWKHLNNMDLDQESMEIMFTKFLYPIPIDQRYTKDDMKDLSEIVRKCING